MNARDELTTLILGKTAPRAADAIVAAGYGKPRTIATVEELDALEVGSVVLNSLNEAATKHGNGWYFPAIRHGFKTWAVALPATLLHEPAAL